MSNENNDVRLTVGTKVLSTDFGVGELLDIEKLQDDGDDYYVIQYGTKPGKNYFPIKRNTKIRTVASKDVFEELLSTIKKKRKKHVFDSKKDRILYFDRTLNKSNLQDIVTRATELIQIDELTPREQKIIDSYTLTLENEAAIIFSIDEAESKKYISGFLK
jgi:RNA polymerase-interacting CarD/CdnL/TRCF family regulator